jgi:hypothetical protein
VLAGKSKVEEGDVSGADVGITGRRWRDASPDGHRARQGIQTPTISNGRS